MTRLASASWVPEDDLLLKNAIEAGASLEALAKGAVRFSRRFTVDELRDRWRSLLYDPVASTEAASRMLQLELSANDNDGNNGPSRFSGLEIGKKPPHVNAKRKVESVRKLYLRMRKKMRTQPFSSVDFLGDCSVGVHNDAINGSRMFGNPCEFSNTSFRADNYGDPDMAKDDNLINSARKDCSDAIREEHSFLSVKEFVMSDGGNSSEHSHSHKDIPLWKAMEDVSPPAMLVHVSLGDPHEGAAEALRFPGDLDGDVDQSGPMSEEGCAVNEIGSSALIPESELVDLSDSLLNFTNEDEPPMVDINGKEVADNLSYDDFACLPGISPRNVSENDLPDGSKHQPSIPNQCLAVQDCNCPHVVDVADPPCPVQGNQDEVCYTETIVPLSTTMLDHQSSEASGELMECLLNTEDPEIPCNDDIISPKEIVSSVIQPSYLGATYPACSNANQKASEYMRRRESTEQPFTASWMAGRNISRETGPNRPVVCGIKSQLVPGNHPAIFYSQTGTILADKTIGGLIGEGPKASMAGSQMGGPFHVRNRKNLLLHTEAGSTMKSCLEPSVEPSMSDQEESESDNDIPCFSDIEAMILGMDLCPDDEDHYMNQQVSRYQTESTRRTLMRLEQSAISSIHRAIASQGAFAVLYGRRLKQYVKKTEVILGRATDDIDVDIDLGREGFANKISRRQALIKMEGDGSFILKNLGKNSIFLNGVELPRGEFLSLASSSLIEIKEMAFIFEIYHRSVRRYLARRGQEKISNFGWYPDVT